MNDGLFDLHDALMFLPYGALSLEEKSAITLEDRCDPPKRKSIAEYASSIQSDEQSLSRRDSANPKSSLASSIGSLVQSTTRQAKKSTEREMQKDPGNG